MMEVGRFYPEHGLERIAGFHQRQDARYAEVAASISESSGKPILVASELAVAQPDNPGVRAVRESGRLCYPSASRAVRALHHAWGYARYLGERG
jgi:acetyltransferase